MTKKELVIILSITLVITLIIIGFIVGTNNEEIDLSQYDITDADMSCYFEVENTSDDSYISSSYNFMYIYKDKDDYVTKVTYKSVYENTYFDSALSGLISNIMDLYDGVEGITTSLEKVNNKTLVTVTYDYENMDIEQIRKDFENILDEESVIMKVKKNIKVQEYIELEDDSYICN